VGIYPLIGKGWKKSKSQFWYRTLVLYFGEKLCQFFHEDCQFFGVSEITRTGSSLILIFARKLEPKILCF
jgi:hypothetical protein